jgi:hypothetical protein
VGFGMDGLLRLGRGFSGGNCLRAAFVVGLVGFVRGGCRGIEADFSIFSLGFMWELVGRGSEAGAHFAL